MNSDKRKSLRNKNAIYSAVLLTAIFLVYQYRNWDKENSEPTTESKTILLEGRTMGVIDYRVKYLDENQINYQKEVDSLLEVLNNSLSTYVPTSEISVFNKSDRVTSKSPFFQTVLKRSFEIYTTTDGAFNPSVMPLVRAWGFEEKKAPEILPNKNIDSLLQLVDMSSIHFDEQEATKTKKEVSLDFGAIAKGYAVDVVGKYLEAKGVQNYMVEIGGEVRCHGKNAKNKIWRIGIIDPKAAENKEQEATYRKDAILELDNRSMATSGNYYNFYMKDGKKYAHTISPKTGYPVEHSLLSVTVVANDCMTADAYATAFMVLGFEKSQELLIKLQERDKIEVYFIYGQNQELNFFASQGMKKMLTIQ